VVSITRSDGGAVGGAQCVIGRTGMWMYVCGSGDVELVRERADVLLQVPQLRLELLPPVDRLRHLLLLMMMINFISVCVCVCLPTTQTS